MGNPDTSYPYPLGLSSGGIIPQRRHDSKQSEAGGQGKGSCGGKKEGIKKKGYLCDLSVY
jgi:hypothetical protein